MFTGTQFTKHSLILKYFIDYANNIKKSNKATNKQLLKIPILCQKDLLDTQSIIDLLKF